MKEWFARLFIRDFTPTKFSWVVTFLVWAVIGYVVAHFFLKYW